MKNNTAKHFALQLGSLISLYLSLSFLLVLLFGIINLLYPSPADYSYLSESAAANVRLGIAMVVVFFPTYLILTRLVNKIRREEKSDTYLTLTKWLIYISLLVGGGVLLTDLAIVIMTFLEGDLTLRFILKALSVVIVVGLAFYYYVLDLRGYWFSNERMSIFFGLGAGVVAAAIVVLGFFYIEAPAEVRDRKIDEKQISDLRNIQWQIQSYYSVNATLPATLARMNNNQLLVAPEGREGYRYAITGTGFELCANFTHPSMPDQYGYRASIDESAPFKNADNWNHAAGTVCFDRVVKSSSSTPAVKS